MGGCSLCSEGSTGTLGTCFQFLPLPQVLCEPLTHGFTSIVAEVPFGNTGAHKERYKMKLRNKPRSRDWKLWSSCLARSAACPAAQPGSTSPSCVWLSQQREAISAATQSLPGSLMPCRTCLSRWGMSLRCSQEL